MGLTRLRFFVEKEFILGSASPGNRNRAHDGTDDSHAYIFAVSSEGKPLWKRELAGIVATAAPVAVDFSGDGRKDLLAWVHTAEFAHQTNAPEVGLVVKLDPRTGATVAQYKAGGCLMSCVAADLDGDGKKEIICTDCNGRIHVLDSDLKPRLEADVVPRPPGGLVDLQLVTVAKLRPGRRPQIVLRSSRFPEIPELISGAPFIVDEKGNMRSGPRDTSIRDENAILVLDSRLEPLAKYVAGTNWTFGVSWEVKAGDVLGDGRPQILSLTDHVEILELSR